MADTKRAVWNYGMALSVVVVLFMFVRSCTIELIDMEHLDRLYIITIPMALSGFTPFASLFAVLPGSASFCDDYNSGYIKNIAIRVGWKRYAKGRIVSTAVSGGLAIALPMAILFIIVLLGALPTTGIQNYAEESGFYANSIWENLVYVGGGAYVLFLKTILGFVFGMVWALVGLAISAYIPNKYVTFLAPFVLYQALWVLLRKQWFNPVYLVRGDGSEQISFLAILGVQLVWILVCSALFYFGVKRRMDRG
jgi:hypothetical protein